MAGTFILSLDCEGKWGMADRLTADHQRWLTSANLRIAYTQLLDLFDEYEVASTFAFVMAFIMSAREQRERGDLFQDQEIDGANWLKAFRAAQQDGDPEGWCMPELLNAVQVRNRHEIGCHGFSHLPLGEQMISETVMRHEIKAAVTVAEARGLRLETFIYPRNLVGRPHVLRDEGFVAYRDRLTTREGKLGKALNLLSELNVAERPQQLHNNSNGIVAIPSGYFFNWRHGARRLIPPAITERRWVNLLNRCARDGGVVHLWLHPHNIISAPRTLSVLQSILRHVARHRDAGTIEIRTQRDLGAHVRTTH